MYSVIVRLDMRMKCILVLLECICITIGDIIYAFFNKYADGLSTLQYDKIPMTYEPTDAMYAETRNHGDKIAQSLSDQPSCVLLYN